MTEGEARVMPLAVSAVRIDGGTQAREQLDQSAIAEYAERMRDGQMPPPVVVFFDGSTHWLADGFHRVMAAIQAGIVQIPVDSRTGSQREAILFAAGANSGHGVRRTNADKRKAVLMLLNDPEWAQWSDREIARRVVVDHSWVGDLRRSLLATNSEKPKTYTTKHGTTATMKTQNIGKTVVTKSGQVKKPVEQRAEEIRELAQQGFVSAQIASRLRISEQQVRKIASDQKIVLANASMGRPRRVDMRRWLEESVMQLEASAAAVGSFPYQFDDMPRDDVAAWAESVGNALAVYRKFHNRMKEYLHENP